MTGVSGGCKGSLRYMLDYPGVVDAAYLGAALLSNDDFSIEWKESGTTTPVWFSLSESDEYITTSSPAYVDNLKTFKSNNTNIKLTVFAGGNPSNRQTNPAFASVAEHELGWTTMYTDQTTASLQSSYADNDPMPTSIYDWFTAY